MWTFIFKVALLFLVGIIVVSESIQINPKKAGFELAAFIDYMSEKYHMRFELLVEENADKFVEIMADQAAKNTKWPIMQRKISRGKKFKVTFDYCGIAIVSAAGFYEDLDIDYTNLFNFWPSKKWNFYWYTLEKHRAKKTRLPRRAKRSVHTNTKSSKAVFNGLYYFL